MQLVGLRSKVFMILRFVIGPPALASRLQARPNGEQAASEQAGHLPFSFPLA